MASVFAKIQLSLVISRPGTVTIAIIAGYTHFGGDKECSEVMILCYPVFQMALIVMKPRALTTSWDCFLPSYNEMRDKKIKKNVACN